MEHGVFERSSTDGGEPQTDAALQPDSAPSLVRRWKRSLLDLSIDNPLLDLPRGQGADLHVPAGALSLFAELVQQGQPFQLIAQDAIGHIHEQAATGRAQDINPKILTRELAVDRRIYASVTRQQYVTSIRALQRAAGTVLRETGGNDLYLTLGTLIHPGSDGKVAGAPLFLVPVRIEGGTGHRPYRIVDDGSDQATANRCLVEWLRVRHGIRVKTLENPIRDGHGSWGGRTTDVRLTYRPLHNVGSSRRSGSTSGSTRRPACGCCRSRRSGSGST